MSNYALILSAFRLIQDAMGFLKVQREAFVLTTMTFSLLAYIASTVAAGTRSKCLTSRQSVIACNVESVLNPLPLFSKEHNYQPAHPERRRTLLVNPLRNQKPTEATEGGTAESSDNSADSRIFKKGFLGGRLHRHSSSPEASLGHDVRAAPGSALARARDELQRARDAETDLENALKRAKV